MGEFLVDDQLNAMEKAIAQIRQQQTEEIAQIRQQQTEAIAQIRQQQTEIMNKVDQTQKLLARMEDLEEWFTSLLVAECCGQRYLKCIHGTFLRPLRDCNRVDLKDCSQDWEMWVLEPRKGKIVFRGATHSPSRYMRALQKGGVEQVLTPTVWEEWMPSRNDDGSWSFLGHNGQYLSANANRTVSTIKDKASSTHFWLSSWK